MSRDEFKKIKMKFALADLDAKIEIYISTQGLSTNQYMELLRIYPYEQIEKLEEAMA